MSHHDMDQDRLEDLAAGTLSNDERRRVEEHVASCERCRDTLAAIRDLAAQTAALPRSIEPGGDLWPGIASGMRARRSVGPWRLALAAAALGWTMAPVGGPGARLAGLLGTDRAGDFLGAEPEEPEALFQLQAGAPEPPRWPSLAPQDWRKPMLEPAPQTG